eukprot:CAMPEP_0184398240 /NCGR_PEP_ID=MMETSP0007-20130409/64703_1 /TAXON_ID=97485 /ORGANISM="Prymnesium parvum, Strain Texoma1" /LENGTH=69 /DNA_ID=CAMNT_0026752081 /DNA_START=167 /DNA_END=376 /DNA_ORIENTATION=-
MCGGSKRQSKLKQCNSKSGDELARNRRCGWSSAEKGDLSRRAHTATYVLEVQMARQHVLVHAYAQYGVV